MLRIVELLITDVSEQPTCPIFEVQAVQEEHFYKPIPVTARSKAWVCNRSLVGIASSNPSGGMDVCLF